MTKPRWWCGLHQDCLDKATNEYQRPKKLSDRPEVVRDLLSLGFITSKRVEVGRKRKGGYNEICLYKLA